MRRWLIFFLMTLLPMQIASAAVLAYCSHEQDASAKHLGHHEHEHQAPAAMTALGDLPDQPAGPAGIGDPDCETCHLGNCALLPVLAVATALSPPVENQIDYRAFFRSYIPSGPERPDRIALTPAARFGGGVAFDPLPT